MTSNRAANSGTSAFNVAVVVPIADDGAMAPQRAGALALLSNTREERLTRVVEGKPADGVSNVLWRTVDFAGVVAHLHEWPALTVGSVPGTPGGGA